MTSEEPEDRRRNWRNRAHWSLRLYAALLYLYPPSLRRGYGGDMLQTFRDSLREEIRCRGGRGALRAWGVALGDLPGSLAREWPREVRQLRRGWPVRRARRYGITRRVRLPGGGWRVEGWISSAPRWGPPRFSTAHRARMGTEPGRRLTMREKFEKFTERARRVLQLAQEEAQGFNHNYIGTEHLLLGLIREEEGVGARALIGLGVDLEKARRATEFIIGRGDRIVLGEVGLTPRAKKVIELAVDEARRLDHPYVNTEHLLLGLVREGEGIAAGVLESLGVSLERARAEVTTMLAFPGVIPSTPAAQEQALRMANSYVTLVCRDVEATAAFYVQALGASAVAPSDAESRGLVGGERLLRTVSGGALGAGQALQLRAATAEEAAVGATTGVSTIELRFIVSDIALFHSAVKARGADMLTDLAEIPGAPSMRAFTLTDPDGRVLRFQGMFRG